MFLQICRSALTEEAENNAIETEPMVSKLCQLDETPAPLPCPCDNCIELRKELKRARKKVSYHRKKKEELQTLLNEANVSKGIIIFGQYNPNRSTAKETTILFFSYSCSKFYKAFIFKQLMFVLF